MSQRRAPSAGRPGRADLALAAGVSLLTLIAPVTGGPGPASSGGSWGALATAAALGQGIPLAWRSTHRLTCAAVVLGCYGVSAMVTGLIPPFGPWLLIWASGTAAVVPVAAGGEHRAAPSRQTLALTLATVALVAVAEAAHPGAGAAALLILVTGLVAISAALLRADRGRVAAERDRGAAQERLRIARDLHDAVGHGLGIVAVQSSTARMALERHEDEAALSAIRAVEAASRTALREMRQMLGVLTDSTEGGRHGMPGITELEGLLEPVRAAGVDVRFRCSDPPPTAAPAVELCVYRVVQEGVTTWLKHAATSRVEVAVEQVGARVIVSVASSGGPGPGRGQGPGGSGSGLAGLRSRVTSLGGTLAVEPGDHAWLVRAELPRDGVPR